MTKLVLAARSVAAPKVSRFNAESLQHGLQRGPLQAEANRCSLCAGQYSVCLTQHMDNMFTLHLAEIIRGRVCRSLESCGRTRQHTPSGQYQHAADHIFQLTTLPRPV